MVPVQTLEETHFVRLWIPRNDRLGTSRSVLGKKQVMRSFCYLDLTPFSVFSICKQKVRRYATICTRGPVCGVSG